ncbi:hypothetical protein GUJ93_ZPchr0007g4350 [Zizania palustris]|uniref:Uncharacterized protein n=1 Tax=Zizania palustris TaxID=103762 RepID=A0A8J5VPZ7_ZIZPA|nr:hypothetical protein GUJ93_ZPchr0007g5667 [Zizania palustris]KAG8080642.1 hypothetical protein GUJ93_ZPchr0007g4350 [Zizania palustris]
MQKNADPWRAQPHRRMQCADPCVGGGSYRTKMRVGGLRRREQRVRRAPAEGAASSGGGSRGCGGLWRRE